MEASGILRLSGVKGGLVVHVGCGDGRFSTALRKHESMVMQRLAIEVDVAKTRQVMRSRGYYGNVSTVPWEGEQLRGRRI